MTRMPMPRDKAAPMDWERENSLSFPNALDSSDSTGFDVQNHQSNSGMKAPSSLFGQQSTNNTPPRTGSFGKGVEPPAQPKRPFSDVWGSATPRPLHQDSLQGSSGFNPPQPPALGGPLFFGNVKRASTFSEQSTNTRESTPGNQSAPFKPTLERSKTQGTSTSNKDQSSFFTFPSSTPKSHILDDQDNQGFDPDITSPTSSALPLTTSGFWGSNRSSTMADEIMKGTHELSIGGRSRPLATGAIKRVLRNRNSMGESEYWNVHADDSLYHQHPSDSETENGHYSHRRESKSRNSSFSRTALTSPNRRNTLQRAGSKSRRPKPSLQQARSWQENIDLPFILSGYAQLLLNVVLVSCLFAVGYRAYAAIQDDVSLEMSKVAIRQRQQFEECKHQYFVGFQCEKPAPNNIPTCIKLEQCMEEYTLNVGKAAVSAQTYATIANAFVHALTFKTMFFFLFLILGGLFVSNYALNSYRTNYVLHHQHHIAAGPMANGGTPFSASKDRNDSVGQKSLFRSLTGTSDSNKENKDPKKLVRTADDQQSMRLLRDRSRPNLADDADSTSSSDNEIAPPRRVLALPSS